MRVNAVIVAAGEGKRMGDATPKVYLPLRGQPLIVHTLRRFADLPTIGKIIVVVAADEMPRCEALIRRDPVLSQSSYVLQPGGATRQDSVRQGLARLDDDCEVVVVHDGARPLVSPRVIDGCVHVALSQGAVVVGVPVRDTIKTVSDEQLVRETLPRERLWAIQTPQAFRAPLIRSAYEAAERRGVEATDDAALVEHLGAPVVVLKGDPLNIKITLPEDLLIAEALLQQNIPA